MHRHHDGAEFDQVELCIACHPWVIGPANLAEALPEADGALPQFERIADSTRYMRGDHRSHVRVQMQSALPAEESERRSDRVAVDEGAKERAPSMGKGAQEVRLGDLLW